ncbi:hypothetical protein ABJI51_05460 [Amycolatopsis sp. NEAU-NG30]|uniref:Uncharacterized protein n=1 Tax=Amycolatopsis melonis TaxID=3156488 RepID=A0ABV0L876_9PSEU
MTGRIEVLGIAGALLLVALAVSLWALRLERARPRRKPDSKPARLLAETQTTVASIQARLRREERAAAPPVRRPKWTAREPGR